MNRLPVQFAEAELVDWAGHWLDRLEIALDRVPGMNATDPRARTLQRYDADVTAWRRALKRGHHTAESAAAVQKVGKLLLTLNACERAALRGETARALIR